MGIGERDWGMGIQGKMGAGSGRRGIGLRRKGSSGREGDFWKEMFPPADMLKQRMISFPFLI